jgi:hypothetical protein
MKIVQIDLVELKNALQPFAALLNAPDDSGEYLILHKGHNSVESAKKLIDALEFKYEVENEI